MDIIYAIAHKIIRESAKKNEPLVDSVIKPREAVFDLTDNNVIALIEALLKVYKIGKTFGSFNSDKDNHPFQTWIEQTHHKEYCEQDFKDISLKTVKRIAFFLNKENFATGGYMIFVHYKIDQQAYFLVVMIKDKGGLTFTEEMELADVHQIDLDKLHQASRVDLNKLENNEESHLSFLKGNSNGDVSGYFTEALGCTDLIQSKVATKNVFNLINSIGDEAGIDRKKIKDISDAIHDFLKSRQPDSVKLEEISAQLNAHLPLEFHEQFIEKANSEEFCISQEFVPNLTALRSFKMMKLEASSWKLSVDKNALGKPDSDAEIIFNAKEKSLSINNLPEKLINQINITLEEKNDE